MSDKKKILEFLDRKLELGIRGLAFAEELSPNQDNIYYWKDEVVNLTEIKKNLIDYYDLIERLSNINFPIEQKRKKG